VSASPLSTHLLASQPQSAPNLSSTARDDPKLREAFDSFVGETFYSQMLKAMRKLTGKPPYFHGGQAEEIFRTQLDQTLAQNLAKSTAHQFTGPMFDLFQLQRG
jgi:Rod binding domain-containing protein